MERPRVASFAILCALLLIQIFPAKASNLERQSSDNPAVSSGTCYWSAGQEADPSYIPCGNTAFGYFHCCEASANCLDNNACYADGITYVAGCTDPTYQDASCPDKGEYSDQQWSGLVYCNGTSDEWTLCNDSAADSNVPVTLLGCYCPDDTSSRQFAFSAASSIANEVSLPASIGGTMSVVSGYALSTVLTSATSSSTSTTSSSSTSSTTSSSSASQTSSSPSSTSTLSTSASNAASASATSSTSTSFQTSISTSSASSSSSSGAGAAHSTLTPSPGLGTGTKAGIGVGAAIGGLILIALLIWLALWYRRRKRQSMIEGGAMRPQSEVQPIHPRSKDELTALPQRSPVWSTDRSELPGHESNSSRLSPESAQQSWSRPMSEVEGSAPTYQSMQSLGSQELSDTSARPGYQPYRRAEVSPIGASGFGTSTTPSHASYRPGRQVESGLYEMPANLPGHYGA